MTKMIGILLAAGLLCFGCGVQLPDDGAHNSSAPPGSGNGDGGFAVTLMSVDEEGTGRYERAYLLGDEPEPLVIQEEFDDGFECRWYSSPAPESGIDNELELNRETVFALSRDDLMKIYYTYRGVLYYRVEVTKDGKTEVSNKVMITVSAPGRITPAVSAVFPAVSRVYLSDTKLTLTAYAHIPPGTEGTLIYEWFQWSAEADGAGAGRVSLGRVPREVIGDEDGSGIRIDCPVPVDSTGTFYYYVNVRHFYPEMEIGGDIASSAQAVVRVLPYILKYMDITGTEELDRASGWAGWGGVTVRDGSGLHAPEGLPEFRGWTTGPECEGDYYAPGAAFMLTENTELYAAWTGSAVFYDTDGAGPYALNAECLAGSVYGITLPGAAFDGDWQPAPQDSAGRKISGAAAGKDVFKGWTTRPDYRGDYYAPGADFMLPGGRETKLYAVWSGDGRSIYDSVAGSDPRIPAWVGDSVNKYGLLTGDRTFVITADDLKTRTLKDIVESVKSDADYPAYATYSEDVTYPVYNGHFLLLADVPGDRVSAGGSPIGDGEGIPVTFDKDDYHPEGYFCFAGSFDGNGRTVELAVTGAAKTDAGDGNYNYYTGLFAYIRGRNSGDNLFPDEGAVRNLRVTGSVTVNGFEQLAAAFGGGLSGVLYDGLVQNVISEADVTLSGVSDSADSGISAGGITGDATGKAFLFCSIAAGNVSVTHGSDVTAANANSGGIFGYAPAGTCNCLALNASLTSAAESESAAGAYTNRVFNKSATAGVMFFNYGSANMLGTETRTIKGKNTESTKGPGGTVWEYRQVWDGKDMLPETAGRDFWENPANWNTGTFASYGEPGAWAFYDDNGTPDYPGDDTNPDSAWVWDAGSPATVNGFTIPRLRR